VTYFFYVSVCLLLTVVQTTVMPQLLPCGRCTYDLMVPFILYLGIFRPIRESLAVIFFAGFVTDNFSAAPFGLYSIIYLWLFAGTKWLVTFLHVGNRILLPLIAGTGVLAENIMFFATFTVIMRTDSRIPADPFGILWEQTLWAAVTGMFLIMMFLYTQKKWDRRLKERSEKENGNR